MKLGKSGGGHRGKSKTEEMGNIPDQNIYTYMIFSKARQGASNL